MVVSRDFATFISRLAVPCGASGGAFVKVSYAATTADTIRQPAVGNPKYLIAQKSSGNVIDNYQRGSIEHAV